MQDAHHQKDHGHAIGPAAPVLFPTPAGSGQVKEGENIKQKRHAKERRLGPSGKREKEGEEKESRGDNHYKVDKNTKEVFVPVHMAQSGHAYMQEVCKGKGFFGTKLHRQKSVYKR